MRIYDDIELIKKLGDGLAGVKTGLFGRQLWVRAETAQRTAHCCAICDRATTKQDRLYRPVKGTEQNRMHRICESCMDKLNN